jgi:CubicO group peptidase (beta-lactamase class C family)
MLPERVERVRDLAEGWVKSGYTQALSVLVARRGVIVLHEAFGRLRPEEDAPPLGRDSIFPVSSVTKPFTATLVMQLVEEGRIGLNRPVVEYIPELTGEGKDQILLHHLLSHTSGYDMPGLIQFMLERRSEVSELPPCPSTQHPAVHKGLHRIYELPLSRPPGQIMDYCNANYALLGEIARRVAGRPYAEIAQERIFTPLGMTDSWLSVPESIRPRIVRRPADAPLAARNPIGMPGLNSRGMEESPHPAMGLYSTSRNLAAFCQTFLNGGSYGSTRLLSRPSVEAMTRNQIPGTRFQFGDVSGPAAMGYGWFVEMPGVNWRPMGTLQSTSAFNHAGAGGAMIWVDPARELVGIYLETLLHGSPEMEPRWNFDLFQNAVTAAVDG